MKSGSSSVGLIISVAFVFFLFCLSPGFFLLGATIFFVGYVCFKAGLLAKEEAMEKETPKKKPEEKSFTTYAERQERTIKDHMKKGFDPNDPKVKAEQRKLQREIREYRKNLHNIETKEEENESMKLHISDAEAILESIVEQNE